MVSVCELDITSFGGIDIVLLVPIYVQRWLRKQLQVVCRFFSYKCFSLQVLSFHCHLEIEIHVNSILNAKSILIFS